jgi:uncharacterized protein YndB with AHSA1/START domain
MMRWILISLGGIAGLIVLAIVVLFFLSKRPGAGDVAGGIDIDRPASEVWAWVTEPEKEKQWVAWLTAIEPTGGPPQGLGHEEIWVMDDPNSKTQYRIPGKITRWEPPHVVVRYVNLPGMFTAEYTYTLTETNGRTHLDAQVPCDYTHPIWSIFEPLVTPEAKKKFDSDLARMKQLAEAAPPSPAEVVSAPGDSAAAAVPATH